MRRLKKAIKYSVVVPLFFGNTLLSLETTLLEEIKVSQDSENFISSNNKYYETKSQSATKTNTPIKEISQSVQVVSNELIEDLNAVKFDDLLDYSSGISRQNNFGGTWDNYSIRGFSGHQNTGMSSLKNGFSDNRGFNAPRDSANIQSIEFLKGPSGSLYGNSEPGGTMNIVTKQPQFDSFHSFKVTTGSYDFYRLDVDTTSSITNSFAYRLNVAAEDKNSFRDYVKSKRYVVAPSFVYALNDNTFLNYMFEYLEQQAPLDRGIFAVDGNTLAIDRRNYYGNVFDNDTTLKNQTHQAWLEHYFLENFSTKIGVAYKNNSYKSKSAGVSPFLNITKATNSINLEKRDTTYKSDDIQFQTDFKLVNDFKNVKNTLIFGFDTYKFEQDSINYRLRNSIRVNNIHTTPTYESLLSGYGALSTNRKEEQKGISGFIQDELAYKDFRFLAGLRFDKIKATTTNYMTNNIQEQNDYAVSPRVGITYLLDDNWSLYTTSGSSFRPNSGVDASGNTFEAEKGLSIESGIKFENDEKNFGGTLSFYKITKKNVLTGSDPLGNYSIASGEARSNGVELDINGKVTNNIKLNFNYAYTGTKITKDSGGAVDWTTGQVVNLEGKQLINIPKNSFNLLLMYEDKLANSGSYGIGSGINYVGKRAGNFVNSFELPSYTTIKLISYYRVNKDLEFRLNIDNLLDKKYILSSYDRSWLTVGSPRTFSLSMNYKF